MTDPTSRLAITELYAGQGWPADGDELLQRSLAQRSPDMLLDAPGWLGLGAGQLVVDPGCRDATWAVALARRNGCRVIGVDLVLHGLSKGGADDAVAAAGQVALVQGDIKRCHSPPARATWCGAATRCRAWGLRRRAA